MDVRDEILIVILTKPAKLSNVELLSSLEKEEKSLENGWLWEALDGWGWLCKNHDFNSLFESFMTILKQEAK